jgi:hypothetical protein
MFSKRPALLSDVSEPPDGLVKEYGSRNLSRPRKLKELFRQKRRPRRFGLLVPMATSAINAKKTEIVRRHIEFFRMLIHGTANS